MSFLCLIFLNVILSGVIVISRVFLSCTIVLFSRFNGRQVVGLRVQFCTLSYVFSVMLGMEV